MMSLMDRVLKRFGYAKQRSYAAGASFNRLNSDWVWSAASVDMEVRSDIRVLRRRARQLTRDMAYARRFVRLVAKNVVGAHGIRSIPANIGANGEPADKANDAITAAFSEWSHKETTSTDRRSSWAEFQRLAISSLVVDGELIVRKWPGFDNAFGFAVEQIDPDLMDETFNRPAGPDGNEIRMGVEVDRFGGPVAYHIWKFHPSETRALNERMRIPAEEIEHLFLPQRAGQTRGISMFAPVLLDVKMLAGYQEAALVNMRTAAAKMGFFITDKDTPEAYQPPVTGEKLVMDASPGMAEQLAPGVTFQEWNPAQPSASFEQFCQMVLRSIAAGLDVSYTSLTGDLSQANYSSARVGLLDERDGWETLQVWFAEHLHRSVYRAWLSMALLTPELSLPSMDARRWSKVRFQARRWAWIDPQKEIQAIKQEIGIGLNSRQNAARGIGRHFEELAEELADENEIAKALKIDVSGATVTIKEDAPGNDAETEPATAAPARALHAMP